MFDFYENLNSVFHLMQLKVLLTFGALILGGPGYVIAKYEI